MFNNSLIRHCHRGCAFFSFGLNVRLFHTLVICVFNYYSQRGLRNRATFALFFAVLVMYTSTLVYWASLLLVVKGYYDIAKSYYDQAHCQVPLCDIILGTCAHPDKGSSCLSVDYGLSGSIHSLLVCAPTAILAINVCMVLDHVLDNHPHHAGHFYP